MAAADEVVLRIGIDGLIGKALSLAKEDLSSLGLGADLKEQLRYMVELLEKVQALLPVAESLAEFKLLTIIVAMTSKADDTLDKCAYEVALRKVEIGDKRHHKVRNLFSFLDPFLLGSKITRKISGINSIIESIYSYLKPLEHKLVPNMDLTSPILEETRELDILASESRFLSGQDDRKGIKELLLSAANDVDLCVITIVGMNGLGKSTLARQVYGDVSGFFDERMWVCVSQDFETDRILKLMLQSFTRSTCNLSSRDAIVYELVERLKGNKYLLVLDDVHNEDFSKWSSLRDCLLKLGGSRGSKIMVTTRTRSVGSVMSWGWRYLYYPRLQTEEESWRMIDNIAFAEGGALRSQELVKIGRQIADKCGGYPLVTKLIAGLLYSKKNEREWLMIDNEASVHSIDHRISMMKLYYDHLPSLTIKQCFAYCCIFPKDSSMEREELIQQWMAHGFLNPPKGSQLTMEDVGKRYLNILIRRMFLQDADQDEDDNRELCKTYGALHDFALLTAKGYCSIIENENVEDNFQATHLSLINCKVEMYKTLGDRFAVLRTLRLVDTGNLGELLAYTKSLRVLIVVDSLLEELPSSIGKLRHLKYLDISKTRIVRLPNSITNLYNLQTLRLYDLEQLPKNFEKLICLRHFHVENFKDLEKLNFLPPKFQELISPSSFKESFKACLGRECQIDMLAQLEQPDKYSSLKIYRLENVNDHNEASKANLLRMSNINSLKLHWSARRENSYDEDVLKGLEPHPNIRNLNIENFKGSKFPSWLSRTGQLHHLVKIELEDCSCCEQIPPLGHLPNLKILKIVGMNSVKSMGTEFYGFEGHNEELHSSYLVVFPALREFYLKHMASLEEWSEALPKSHSLPRAFECLEKLEVEDCPKLTRLPDTLNGGCKYLQHLEIASCNELTHLPKVLGRLEFLQDLEMRSLPSLPEMFIQFPDKLRSLTIGSFFSASEGNYHRHRQHAFASSSSLHLALPEKVRNGSSLHLALPEKVRNLSKLRHLAIWGYSELEALPEWLGELQSLKILKLELCGKLKYLPSSAALRQLADLVELNVCFCPLLEERCMKGNRPEWHKISHIRTIKMSYETIQSPKS